MTVAITSSIIQFEVVRKQSQFYDYVGGSQWKSHNSKFSYRMEGAIIETKTKPGPRVRKGRSFGYLSVSLVRWLHFWGSAVSSTECIQPWWLPPPTLVWFSLFLTTVLGIKVTFWGCFLLQIWSFYSSFESPSPCCQVLTQVGMTVQWALGSSPFLSWPGSFTT